MGQPGARGNRPFPKYAENPLQDVCSRRGLFPKYAETSVQIFREIECVIVFFQNMLEFSGHLVGGGGKKDKIMKVFCLTEKSRGADCPPPDSRCLNSEGRYFCPELGADGGNGAGSKGEGFGPVGLPRCYVVNGPDEVGESPVFDCVSDSPDGEGAVIRFAVRERLAACRNGAVDSSRAAFRKVIGFRVKGLGFEGPRLNRDRDSRGKRRVYGFGRGGVGNVSRAFIGRLGGGRGIRRLRGGGLRVELRGNGGTGHDSGQEGFDGGSDGGLGFDVAGFFGFELHSVGFPIVPRAGGVPGGVIAGPVSKG